VCPGHLPGQAQLVQPTGVVPGDPRRKDVTLPLAGRHLEALELLDDAEQPGASVGMRSGGDVEVKGHNTNRRVGVDGPAFTLDC
jgi:hypothetical protein